MKAQAPQTRKYAPPLQRWCLQRKCVCGNHTMAGECEDCSKKKQTMQHASLPQRGIAIDGEREAPPIVHEVLRSPGQPLDPATRAFFESRLGHDFGKVRVHTDAKAAESVRGVDALAYAVNQEIAFGSGQYSPHTIAGRRLLAHELAHTIQQRNALGSARTAPPPAEAEARRAEDVLDKPTGVPRSLHLGIYSPGLYRQTAGGSSSATPIATTGLAKAEFERTMRRRFATATLRTGTQAEQAAEVASRVRRPASEVVLPQWQSWNPGASSQVYDLILESLEGFQHSIGGVPVIREIIFFSTDYEVSLNPAGVAIAQPKPDIGGSFGGGVLTIYRTLAISNKALPVARSNLQGNYPSVVIGVGGITGQTPGAPLPLPGREESVLRQLTHELGHGLAEAAMSIEPAMFDDYRREVGWTATNSPQLFDIGQPTVQTALTSGSPPPTQFEITVNDWNSPRWVEQPVSWHMVKGGPGEDFAEAVMTFVRDPNLLLSRSPHRFGRSELARYFLPKRSIAQKNGSSVAIEADTSLQIHVLPLTRRFAGMIPRITDAPLLPPADVFAPSTGSTGRTASPTARCSSPGRGSAP